MCLLHYFFPKNRTHKSYSFTQQPILMTILLFYTHSPDHTIDQKKTTRAKSITSQMCISIKKHSEIVKKSPLKLLKKRGDFLIKNRIPKIHQKFLYAV